MKTRLLIPRTVLLAALVTLLPVQGNESPREIFTKLSAPTEPVPMQEKARAEAMPALAFLPAEAEFVLALRDAASSTREIMRLLDCPMDEGQKSCMESIANAALVIGNGPGGSPQEALPILMYAARTQSMNRCEAQWCERAKPELVPAIHRAFRKQAALAKSELLNALERFHLAPIYYAATPRPGRESDFASAHAQMVEGLKKIASREDGVHFVQHGPYTGLRMSQLRAWKLITGEEPQDAELRLALEQRELYLLTMMVQNAALSILCESPADISLPASPEFSMIYSPKLDRCDPHAHHMIATAWMSSALSTTMRASSLLGRLSMAQSVVSTLREISMEDPANRRAYESASAGVASLALCPGALDAASTPLTIQMWQQEHDVIIETVGGAQGMTFKPGKLRLVSEATSPGTFFYMESTAFDTPHFADWMACRTKLLAAVPDICNGIALTLRKSERGTAEAWAYYMRLLSEDVESLGQALETLSTGMGAPFAVVGAEVSQNDSPAAAWAIGAAAKNREAISDGWQQILKSLGHALGKLGLPPILVHAFPTEHKKLGDQADSYSLTVPFSAGRTLPSVALNNGYFVLGNNAILNERLLMEAKGEVPFTGAVNSVHVPTMARVLRASILPLMEDSPCAARIAGFVQRLAERVEWLFSTSTIDRGLRTARARMTLLPEKEEEQSASEEAPQSTPQAQPEPQQ